jgi:hypothetical protein
VSHRAPKPKEGDKLINKSIVAGGDNLHKTRHDSPLLKKTKNSLLTKTPKHKTIVENSTVTNSTKEKLKNSSIHALFMHFLSLTSKSSQYYFSFEKEYCFKVIGLYN